MNGPTEFKIGNVLVVVPKSDSWISNVDHPVAGISDLSVFYPQNKYLSSVQITSIAHQALDEESLEPSMELELELLLQSGLNRINVWGPIESAIRRAFGKSGIYFSKISSFRAEFAVVVEGTPGYTVFRFSHKNIESLEDAAVETESSMRAVVD